MLIKLFKNEFKATGRIFLPLYGILAIFAAVSRFSVRQFDSASTFFTGILMVLPVILYGCIIAALGTMCLVLLVQRFKKNLLDDEGYLMHTLPVRVGQHIFTKLMTSFFWTVLTTIAVVLSVLFVALDMTDWASLWELIQSAFDDSYLALGLTPRDILIWIAILALASSIKGILMVYASLSIGQTASRRKLASGIGMVVVCIIAEQFIASGAISLLDSYGRTNIFLRNNFPLFGEGYMRTIFRLSLIQSVAFGTLYAWISMRMLKRHLNLA